MNYNQSRQNYNGYVIKLVFREFEGGGFQIIKSFGIKEFILRETYFNFILPENAISKAKNYIDGFSDKLIEKQAKKMEEYKSRVLKNPKNFEENIVNLVKNNFNTNT